ncbi:MAG TPA: VOC family protein [Yinghuangia sp.]|uniref:VOC family protein n=1 Tax=Yinghuangia sp. YIM S10712 TaxID=3436930 RepID=UPI002BB12BB1|nr:VOC family protein [Yinghuangia sp.]
MSSTNSAPAFTFIGCVVDDMAATLAFYRRLGLDIPADADTQPHVEAPLPGGLLLVWDTAEIVRSFAPHWEAPRGGRIGLAFTCTDPASVDRTHDDLVSAGYRSHLAPFDAPWGQRYATVLDPDGNGVDLLAALPAD